VGVPGGCSSPAKRPTKASAPGLGRRRRRPRARGGETGRPQTERTSRDAAADGRGLHVMQRRRKKKGTRMGLLLGRFFHNFFRNFLREKARAGGRGLPQPNSPRLGAYRRRCSLRVLSLCADWTTCCSAASAAALHQVPRPSSGPSPATSSHQVCPPLLFPSCCAKRSTQRLT